MICVFLFPNNNECQKCLIAVHELSGFCECSSNWNCLMLVFQQQKLKFDLWLLLLELDLQLWLPTRIESFSFYQETKFSSSCGCWFWFRWDAAFMWLTPEYIILVVFVLVWLNHTYEIAVKTCNLNTSLHMFRSKNDTMSLSHVSFCSGLSQISICSWWETVGEIAMQWLDVILLS
jgi:hypothetical protein